MRISLPRVRDHLLHSDHLMKSSAQWSRRGFLAGLGSLLSVTSIFAQTSADQSTTQFFDESSKDQFLRYAMIPPTELQRFANQSGTQIADRIAKLAGNTISQSPRPQPVLQTAGLLPGEGLFDISLKAAGDFGIARDLALHGLVGHDLNATYKAADYIQAWAEVYKPSFMPINETKFDALMIAYDLLPPKIKSGLKANVADLWSQFAFGYRDKKMGGMSATSNVNSHRVKLLTLSAFLVGDPELISFAHSEFEEQLLANISSDGLVIDFKERDAIHYVVYSLEPLIFAALAGQHHHQDWWSNQDERLSKAVAWLLPFANGTQQHEEFLRSPVAFDKKRAMAGITGYSGLFNPHDAGYVMALAARFEPELYTDIAKSSSRSPAWLDILMPLT